MAGVVCIAGMTLAGWAFDVQLLKGISPHWTAMRVITALCFLLSVVALGCLYGDAPARWRIILSRVLGVVVAAVAVLTLAIFLIELTSGQEWTEAHRPVLNLFLDLEKTRMAVITAMLFAVFGGILVLLGARWRWAAGVCHVVLLPVTLLSYLVLVGYLFDVRAFYEWMHLGVALNTGIAFFALCVAAFCARPDTWLTSVFAGREAGGAMARRMLPALLLLPLAIGWLRIYGERQHFFASELGVALVAVTYTICFLGLMWFNARGVNRTDHGRFQAEESLRQSEQRLRTILDALPVAIFLSDQDGNVIFTNPAVETIWGISAHVRRDEYGQYQGRWVGTGLPVEPEQWALARVLETGQPFTNDLVQLDTPDGRQRIIHNFALPIRGAGGQMTGVVVVTEDVTERVRAERVLRQAKDDLARQVAERTADLNRTVDSLQQEVAQRTAAQCQLDLASRYARSLLEASLDPLVTISPEGKITDVNQATEEATGLPRAQLIGTDFSAYFTEPELARQSYQAVLAEEFVRDYPLTLRHQSGRTMDVLYNATVFLNPSGEIQGVFAAARDITQRKLVEEELSKYRQGLEDLVKQRTAELERTADELLRSNKDLEQFAYVSSHDLQEPLRMVTGFMQLFEKQYKGALDATADKYISYAVDGAKRMQRLIDDLLAYSRVGSKGKQLVPTDLGVVVRQAMANLHVSVEESQAQITCGDLPTLRADEMQLGQVFQNLLGNAIKFRGDAPPQIRVEACPAGPHWLFSVKDNGIGLAPEYYDKVFVIFQRLHTKEKYAGTGIGLAICKKIIERHGGRIWVESREGQGATFYFTLPA
jgi:PAS domain S-box-containing protein